MRAERLRQLSPIFRRAVDLPPGERAAFLDSACAGDAAARRDVERLITAHESAGSFIEAPAYERAAGLLSGEPAASVVGRHINHYRIVAPLGKGGMGEVYLADDTKLERSVALKFLSVDVASNEERMRRFTQEAKAAAALNHPNIAHVYEIGEVGGTHFIAMEYVDGVTLNEKMHREKTPLERLLGYLTQVAQGLAKAHAAGIVHRDLKPDNIMITRDDYAKILDFGLAKLVEPQGAPDAGGAPPGEAATAILAEHSTPGLIMGTVGYMSPEQAQGRVREIDHRSDIFSFGCILFEAATGQKAFAGTDTLDSLHRTVHAPTPQIKDFNAAAPAELQRIVRRCLAKDTEERYQSIKDAAIELDEVRRELKDTSAAENPAGPESLGGGWAGGSQQAGAVSTRDAAAGATRPEIARTTSSAEYLVGEVRAHRRGVFLALAGVAVVIALGVGVYSFVNRPGPAPRAPFQAMKMTKLTSNGKATSAVVSPDGKQVFYVVDDGGLTSLWLRQVATATDVQLAPPENIFYIGLTISPDGNFLYYATGGESLQKRVLYKMPVLGGSPSKVIGDVGSPISFSPDGRQIAFVRNGDAESTLMIANADGTAEREIAKRQAGRGFGDLFEGGTAWSPDGRRIASIARNRDDAGLFYNVVEIPVEGGTERVLTPKRWYRIHRLAWLADGSGLLMTAAEQPSDLRARQIWHLGYASGEARKVTNDLNNYGSISQGADSGVLVTVQEDHAASIWVAPGGDAGRATQITSMSSRLEGSGGVAWAPDGRIVYHSWAGGSEDIWIMEADGKNRKQLSTGEAADYNLSVSADGRYVVFVSERTGSPKIWGMGVDGSNPKQLAGGGNPLATAEWLIYQYQGGVWKMPIDGGEPVRIFEENLRRCDISPDGRLIAGSLRRSGNNMLAVISIDGGEPAKVFDVPHGQPPRVRWAPDGLSVTYVARQNGVDDIWSQPLAGGAPRKLTDFKSDFIFSFDWSRDNRLVISHGSETSDVVLIRDAR